MPNTESMSGFNENLKENERINCLLCSSTKETIIKDEKEVCPDCGNIINFMPQIPKTDSPAITAE